MTTPNKERIIAKAKELYVEHCYRSVNAQLADLNPEIAELRENGFISQAVSELMRNEETKYENWVHNGSLEVEALNFDVDLAKKRGTFISGSRGSGKTNLGKLLVDKLLKQGYIVKVFDSSQAWMDSSVPNLMHVKPNNLFDTVDFGKSIVFDIALLYPKQQREFIEFIVKKEFTEQVNSKKRLWHFYVFEEVELLIGTHNRSEEIMRLICVGRNFKLSYIALAQRFAMVSTSLISLAGQLYIGNAHEENDMKKLRNWLGHHVNELEDLSVGEFLYKHGKSVEKLETPEFKTDMKPMQIQTQVKLSEPLKPSVSNSDAAISLVSFATWSILALLVVSQLF